jgi:DNA-binding Xre family transcriptional regulator
MAPRNADVRGCVEAIAAHVSRDPDELLELATYEAGCEARSAAHKKEEVEREISRKVRERTLPDEKTLEKQSMEVNVERLKELRRERVLSLRELEERSGVSYNTIWRIEDGRQGAHPRTVRKLANALGVQPSELIREG